LALQQRLEAWRDIYAVTRKVPALDDEIAPQIDRGLERGRALARDRR
jgi:hypothetical protein